MIVPFLVNALLAPVPAVPGRARQILEANRIATERSADATHGQRRPAGRRLRYTYAGDGMTGVVDEIDDLRGLRYVITRHVGEEMEQDGYDGRAAWARERSGSVTPQSGGDMRALAVNQAYRNSNLWWRSDLGGAKVSYTERQGEGAAAADVLKITPVGGVPFEAWFDAGTHLLSRVDERREGVPTTIRFSKYKVQDGALLAGRISVGTGDVADEVVQTLERADILGSVPEGCCAAPAWTVSDVRLMDGSNSAIVPFRIFNGHIYVDAVVDGKGPFPFLVDTGGVNMISPSTANAAGIKAAGALTMRGAGVGVVVGGIAKVGSLVIGTAMLRNQPMRVLPQPDGGIEQGGMLGFETLRRFVTRIDYGRRTIEFIKPETFSPEGAGTPVPIAFYGNLVIAKGSYDGVPGDFTIDTGNPGSLFLSSPFSEVHSLQSHVQGGLRVIAGVGIGGPSYGLVFRGGPLKLGSVLVERPVALISTDAAGAMADPALAGNIGAAILRRFVLTLDYAHSLIYLKAITPPPPGLDIYDRSGLRISKTPLVVTVEDVAAGTPAAVAGVQKGDVLESIAGISAGKVSIDQIRSLLRDQPPGTKVSLTLRRKGNPLSIVLTLRELV
ncbi:PDZ domain-containing protein [Sphingomonas sp. NFX23]|uniref:PDZ domain-containing protein n=1 Tax=Sphingomonas sp. NFX23 TaxID=2819532 RepID=UPI003CE85E82